MNVGRALCFLFIHALGFSLCAAQTPSSPKAAVDALKGRNVLLRSMYQEDSLAFDAKGDPVGPATPGPFSLSVMTVSKVHVSAASVELRGHRGIIFFTGSPRDSASKALGILPLGDEEITIMIALDPMHPELTETALKKIFALTPADALSGKSPTDQKDAIYSIGAFQDDTESPGNAGQPATKFASDIMRPGSNVTQPQLLHHVDPTFTDQAREAKFSGMCRIGMVVDTSGRPIHIRVLQPLGYGLEQNALIAVSQYRFKPAMFHGKPVKVQIQVEVNFQIR